MEQSQNNFIKCNGNTLIRVSEIAYCKASDYATIIVLDNGEELKVSKVLREVQARLEENGFIRAHKSYLICMDKVRLYDDKEKYVELINGIKLPVSRRKKNEILSRVVS